MPRPTTAIIDIAAMRHNLEVARTQVPNACVWAVVKANAYGHGLERGMRGFAAADGLALIEVEAAEALRQMGWKRPILLLEGFFDSSDLSVASRDDIQVTIHSSEQIDLLEQAHLTSPIDVHLKMNSGMNRLGFQPQDYRDAYARLKGIAGVRTITLMTHFANADDADNLALPLAEQIARFQGATDGLPGQRSLFNSAATLQAPAAHTDWTRPGVMLYGGTSGGKSAAEYGLRAAMTLTSEIIGVQMLKAGEAIGYGSRFVAETTMRVGVVACGYADGYPRHAPNGTPVMVDGHRTQMVGRVSMDMITVDLTDIAHARVGSTVELWGENLPIDEVANAAGTIGYELMCALAARVKVVER